MQCLRIPCEVYSRVCGYLRPTFAWNAGKQQEFKERKMFDAGKDSFGRCLAFTLSWEGGYTNNPADRGGATNYGITQRTYDDYRKSHPQALADVKDITSMEVRDIYYLNYWLTSQCDLAGYPLNLALFDWAVNSGPSRAVKGVQEALGLKIDGIAGKITIQAISNCDTVGTAKKLCDLREKFCWDIVRKDQTQKVFIQGWVNRINDLRRVAGL